MTWGNGGSAWLLLAPDTPRVRGLARALARTLACPRDPAAKRSCASPSAPPNFHCMFMPPPQPTPQPQPSQPAQAVANGTGAEHALGGDEGQEVLQPREKRVESARIKARSRAWAEPKRFLGWGWGLPWHGGVEEPFRCGVGAGGPPMETEEADPCADFDTCVSTPACYEHVLRDQMAFMASEEVRQGYRTRVPVQ